VRAAGRAMTAAGLMVQPSRSEPAGDRIVHRLWAALSDRAPSDAEIATLEAALILLTDHELAASTFAARVAASAWADPYLVVMAGLAAVSGSLHGRTSTPAAVMLRAAIDSGDVPGAIARTDADLGVPGFGHKVYQGPDPRAETLLDLVAGLDTQDWPVIDAALAAGSSVTGREANVDFALAAFVVSADLPIAAGELIFGIARLAGVIAHAIEEYEHRLRFRPRAIYTGITP
jgi:citrate synthase